MLCCAVLCFAMLYFIVICYAMLGSAPRTPGQDYCGLALVSPAPLPTSTGTGTGITTRNTASAYSSLPCRDYMLLCVILSLSHYLLAPKPGHAGSSSSSSGGRMLLRALSEIHRMFLLVDGRYGYDVHSYCFSELIVVEVMI